jgi:DNA mismatch repair ATPase MutL
MLKTAATISNKTEHFIGNSNQQIALVDNSITQKDISLFQSKDAAYDRKYLSKQLLSQIHFCRFLFKLIVRIGEKLPPQTNQELEKLKECMVGLIFNKLDEVEHLRALPAKIAQDFKASSDYQKIYQIIEQYQAKYSKELSSIRETSKSLPTIKE